MCTPTDACRQQYATIARVTRRIQFETTDVLDPDLDVRALRRRIGMIFQKLNPFPLSVLRNLELPLREHGAHHREVLNQKIETALCDVGLWNQGCDRLNSSALALSGGQQ